ncbi:hypothetical protein FYK55_00935 [Roseiconus nitratireducens]|uniref:Uncharacterized protein n=1 Tax=Roseiconus nitratireducens TaxID=2605748 RepID=A0A5M6DNL1_9BACT|nr:hypothetical protein [Roseiconus nitratireducens]KAA5547015.1 hypothetical protein FYK55_00935 [Roseiconus nitratireducens]
MRHFTEQDIAKFKRSDRIENPTEQQFALACEGADQAEKLMAAGWKSLGHWIKCQERDIDSGHRQPPALASAAS